MCSDLLRRVRVPKFRADPVRADARGSGTLERSLCVIASLSRLARACASARVGAHTRMGRDNETITERDNCLCLRLAPRVCTLGNRKRRRRRRRRRRSRRVAGSAGARCAQGCLYVQTRGRESALALALSVSDSLLHGVGFGLFGCAVFQRELGT
jgi:hypothetical protein